MVNIPFSTWQPLSNFEHIPNLAVWYSITLSNVLAHAEYANDKDDSDSFLEPLKSRKGLKYMEVTIIIVVQLKHIGKHLEINLTHVQ